MSNTRTESWPKRGKLSLKSAAIVLKTAVCVHVCLRIVHPSAESLRRNSPADQNLAGPPWVTILEDSSRSQSDDADNGRASALGHRRYTRRPLVRNCKDTGHVVHQPDTPGRQVGLVGVKVDRPTASHQALPRLSTMRASPFSTLFLASIASDGLSMRADG